MKSASYSYSNVAETKECRTLVDGLLTVGGMPRASLPSRFTRNNPKAEEVHYKVGVDLSTWTRLSIARRAALSFSPQKLAPPFTSECLDDSHRMFTHCCYGQLVLGDRASLIPVPFERAALECVEGLCSNSMFISCRPLLF